MTTWRPISDSRSTSGTRAPRSPLGLLHLAHGIGHEPRELLGLNREELHLGLRVTALQCQHFLHVLGARDFAREIEGAFGVLLGEAHGAALHGLGPRRTAGRWALRPRVHGLTEEVHELAIGRARLLDILLCHLAQLWRNLEGRGVAHN